MPEPVNKNLFALYENHERGTPVFEEDEEGNKAWVSGAYPIVCLEGATRSGKTWAWEEYLINASQMMAGLISTAFRYDASTHEEAAIRDFKQLMLGKYKPIWDAGKWNGTLKTFTFKNGSIIEFDGTNNPGKLHGPARDIAVLNEVMEITYEAYRQIAARTRLMVIMDWNPSLSSHWVFNRVLKRKDVLYVHTTYKDNPHLTTKQVTEIEGTNPGNPANVRNGTADAWYWDVYGLGKRGRREGVVFPFFDIVDHWPDMWNCQKHGFGLDFGFSNDPTALIECAIFQGKLYLREWIYETGLIACKSHAKPNTPSIQGMLELYKFDKSWKVIADGARPDIIAELVNEGFNVFRGVEGKKRILPGIDLMKKFPICVARDSIKIQEELEQYAWKRHADGSFLDEPEDKWNHAIDAVRYWSMDELAGWQPVRRNGTKAQACGRKRKRY